MNRRATTSVSWTAGTCRATSRCATRTAISGFVGRADDLIKTSGHLIGPFEVESALIEHDAVAEAGVIGRARNETAGEIVKAYVTLNPGVTPSDDLERDIRGHARKRLGPAVAPREGRVSARRCPRPARARSCAACSKARELGLPEGDISTLETDEDMSVYRQTPPRPGARARPLGPHDPHPPLRGQMRRALYPAEDPRLPASL